jgi:hypothetical protein
MNILRMCLVFGLLCWLPGGLTAPLPVEAAGQANGQYVIERDTINAGGGVSQSVDYVHVGTIGQASPLSTSSTAQYVLYAGFWHGKAFTLSVVISGSGTVKDCLSPGACPGTRIDCGSDCVEFYNDGDSVLLQAFPEAGSTFVHWLVDGAPVTAPLYVTRDLIVTAVFESAGSNLPPAITSTPPSLTGMSYTYVVQADDPDDDPLTYSLPTAPAGMSIDAQSGLIQWSPTAAHSGDHAVLAQVGDGKGGFDSQAFRLHVSVELFETATVPLFAGFDVESGTAACDASALTLVPGPMTITDEILLPPGNSLDFGPAADFHLEYAPSAAGALVLALEPGVTGVLLPDRAYESVTAADIAGLSAWPAAQPVTSRDTVIILTAAGQYVKLGHLYDHPQTWTVSFNYAELQ